MTSKISQVCPPTLLKRREDKRMFGKRQWRSDAGVPRWSRSNWWTNGWRWLLDTVMQEHWFFGTQGCVIYIYVTTKREVIEWLYAEFSTVSHVCALMFCRCIQNAAVMIDYTFFNAAIDNIQSVCSFFYHELWTSEISKSCKFGYIGCKRNKQLIISVLLFINACNSKEVQLLFSQSSTFIANFVVNIRHKFQLWICSVCIWVDNLKMLCWSKN